MTTRSACRHPLRAPGHPHPGTRADAGAHPLSAQTRELLKEDKDFAVILLDVVMETEDNKPAHT